MILDEFVWHFKHLNPKIALYGYMPQKLGGYRPEVKRGKEEKEIVGGADM